MLGGNLYAVKITFPRSLAPGGPIPHNLAKTFDGPPTLELSGSEHRRAVTSPLPEEEGLGEKVELSLQERRRGRKKAFFNGKEGRDDFRKADMITPVGEASIIIIILKLLFLLMWSLPLKNKINEGKQKLSWLCQESLLLF